MDDKILENNTIGPWQILAIQSEHKKIIDLYIIRNDVSNKEALRVHEVFGIEEKPRKLLFSRIKVLSNELNTLLHEVIEDARVTCVLCNSRMTPREGKYGAFYACSKSNITGCVCTADSTGKLSKKTRTMLAMKKPRATTELDKLLGQTSIQKRIAGIEID